MKLKIIVIGPKGSGKTQISNYLAGHNENFTADRYEPTAGVRILEGETLNGQLSVEMWDCSGDQKLVLIVTSNLLTVNYFRYEACWRAIMHEADGVILVYNPDTPGQDQQLNDWFDFFVKKNGLRDDQCLIFAHRSNPSSERFRPRKKFESAS